LYDSNKVFVKKLDPGSNTLLTEHCYVRFSGTTSTVIDNCVTISKYSLFYKDDLNNLVLTNQNNINILINKTSDIDWIDTNLFITDFSETGTINTNGSDWEVSGYGRTGYIEIDRICKIKIISTLNANSGLVGALYDSNKVFVKKLGPGSNTLLTEHCYVRFSGTTSTVIDNCVTISNYSLFYKDVSDKVKSSFAGFLVRNGFILQNGNINNGPSNWLYSDFIRVYKNDIIYNNGSTISPSSGYRIAFYGVDKIFVEGTSNATYTVMSDGYIRVSVGEVATTITDFDTYFKDTEFLIRAKDADEILTRKFILYLQSLPYEELKEVIDINKSILSNMASSQNSNITLLGDIQYRKTILTPAHDNVGCAYLYDNNGSSDLQLHIVKDQFTVVGCSMSIIKSISRTITAKSFSMCHFGDSITYGAGTTDNKGYVGFLKDKLSADGHNITLDTNKGISGATAESLCSSYASLTPLHHDVATLMIGCNDRDRWFSQKGNDYRSYNNFRAWYRYNLRNLINLIKTYSTCSILYLISPYYYKNQLYTDYLHHHDECIMAAADMPNVYLCRGDLYIQDGELGGLHVNNDGATLLAEKLRQDITYDISSRLHKLSGVVTDANGAAVSGVSLVISNNYNTYSINTDSSGAFSTNIIDGSYKIIANGYTLSTSSLVVNKSDITVNITAS
jgi:lysophospholipase L1-like esterase